MSHVLIRFDDTALESFHYARPADDDLLETLQWQAANEGSLKDVCSGHSVIFFIPQQAVLTTSLELPEKASRQLLAAIDFQVEDRLAQEVENQHVAVGDTGESPLPVVVVSRDIMDLCLELSNRASFRLQAILPEFYLCPYEAGTIRVIELDGQLLCRSGPHSAIKTDKLSLPVMLELLGRDTQFRLLSSADEISQLTLPEGWQQETSQHSEPVSSLLGKSVINLLQRDYRSTSPWLSLARQWRWVAIFLFGLITVTGYNQWHNLQQLESQVTNLKQQQFQLVSPYLPSGTTADDNLKSLLIRELSTQQGAADEQGFLSTLQRFSKAKLSYQQISVDRITYQRDTLKIDLMANQLNVMEDLLQIIRRTDSAATLDDLSVKPGEVSATLVITGGENG